MPRLGLTGWGLTELLGAHGMGGKTVVGDWLGRFVGSFVGDGISSVRVEWGGVGWVGAVDGVVVGEGW